MISTIFSLWHFIIPKHILTTVIDVPAVNDFKFDYQTADNAVVDPHSFRNQTFASTTSNANFSHHKTDFNSTTFYSFELDQSLI